MLIGALIPLVTASAFSVETLLVSGIALTAVVILGPILFFFRGRALMEPITYYAAISFLFLGASALYWLGTPVPNPVGLNRGDVVIALGVVIVAFVALWLGYFSVRRGVSAVRGSGASMQVLIPNRSLVLVFAAIGVLSRIIQVTTNTYGYQTSINASLVNGGAVPHGAYLGILTYAGVALEASIFLAAVRIWAQHHESAPRADWIVLCLLVAVDVAFGFASGFKGAFVAGVIMLLICYGKYRPRLPWKPLLVYVVLILVSVPFNLKFRSLAQEKQGEGSLALTSQALSQTVSDKGSTSDAIATWAPTRLRQIDNVAVVVRDTPRLHPMLHGRDLLISPAVVLIPRALWPEKPVVATGLDFAREYLGQRSTVTSSTGVTQIGDLFRNFGLAGVVIGMVLLGMIFGGLSRAVQRTSPTGTLLIAALATVLAQFESDWIALLAIGVRTMAVTGVIVLIVRAAARHEFATEAELGPRGATA